MKKEKLPDIVQEIQIFTIYWGGKIHQKDRQKKLKKMEKCH